MNDEFKEARDEANHKRYEVEQHDMYDWEAGANWAYEWMIFKVIPKWSSRCILKEEKIDKLNKKLAKADKIIQLNMGSTLDEVLSWESEKEGGEE